MIKFTIPVPPVTKKNHMSPRMSRAGKFLGLKQSDAYLQYEADCLKLIPGFAKKHISCPVNVKAVYYMKTRRRVDKTNLESALLDILVKAGVLADDSALNPEIVVSTDGSRVYWDREYPRVEVEITDA